MYLYFSKISPTLWKLNNLININNKIYSNNNTILLSIIKDLQQTMNDSRENNTIKRLGDIIIKMNSVISEIKKH